MAESFTLRLSGMAHGGAALGRDAGNRVIFVPLAIPGEEVVAEVVADKGRYAQARLRQVLQPSPHRVPAPCPHFGACGGCHLQHVAYAHQLHLKAEVVADQLGRIAGLRQVPLLPPLPNPEPYHYSHEIGLSPTAGGGVGLWFPAEERVEPLQACHLIRPELWGLLQDFDIQLPGLRRLTLRAGSDGALLAALEVEGLEPPEIDVDFPLSLAIVLPDGTAATLIGESFLLRQVGERLFRHSAGSFFYPSQAGSEQLVQAVVAAVAPAQGETLLELYSGVGALTAFLAPLVAELVAVEANADAVADAAANLDDLQNVSLYQGTVEEVLPQLEIRPQWVVVDPPGGLPAAVRQQLLQRQPTHLVYVSQDVATLARDGRHLGEAGYHLASLALIDMQPQTFHILTVSHWQR